MSLPWTALAGILRSVLLALVLGYFGLGLFAAMFANKLVFPAPSPSYTNLPGLRKIQLDDENRSLALRYLPNAKADFLLFYHHGNAEDLGMLEDRLKTLHELGFSVLAWDFPGYGQSPGRPSEDSITAAARFLWKKIPEETGYAPDKVILYGRSVGGGPAVALACEYAAGGLILESTFTSAFRVVTRVRLLPWDIYNNLARIGKLRCPLLLLHGTRDGTVPFQHGKTLFAAAPEPKIFTSFQGGGHNNLVEDHGPAYADSIRRFLRRLRKGNAG